MKRRAQCDGVDAARSAFFVGMDEEVDAKPARRLVAERDHLAEFPAGIDVQVRKGRLAEKERFARQCSITLEPLPIE
jgi:hypothetical protein